jgi:hypothetical protein
MRCQWAERTVPTSVDHNGHKLEWKPWQIARATVVRDDEGEITDRLARLCEFKLRSDGTPCFVLPSRCFTRDDDEPEAVSMGSVSSVASRVTFLLSALHAELPATGKEWREFVQIWVNGRDDELSQLTVVVV